MVFHANYENGQTERIVSPLDDEAMAEAFSYETKNGKLLDVTEIIEEHNLTVRTVFCLGPSAKYV